MLTTVLVVQWDGKAVLTSFNEDFEMAVVAAAVLKLALQRGVDPADVVDLARRCVAEDKGFGPPPVVIGGNVG